jgi:glycosyltransferase involved in cell wall biosynthesis
VQDLWPHTLTAAVQIKNKLILSFVDNLTKWIYKNCEKILVQSEGFINYIASQGIPKDKIIFYPNSTEAYFKPVIPSENIKKLIPANKFTIMFAGNIGESQDFETIINTAKKVVAISDRIQFIILGDGRKKKFVEQRVQELGIGDNFLLLGAFPSETMPEFFACADALLVSLRNDRVFDLTIPSKIQSYLACRKPLIGSLNGEGSRVIKEANAGVVAPAGDPDKLTEKILELYNADFARIKEMQDAAGQYFEKNFEREILLDKLINILNENAFNPAS